MKKFFQKGESLVATSKEKLENAQLKPWAKSTATALNISGTLINTLGVAIPGIGFLGGALKVGSAVLNPNIKMTDLRRTEDLIVEDIGKVQTEVEHRFAEVAIEMKTIISEVQDIFTLVTEAHYKDGPEKVEAMYDMFLDGSDNIAKTFELFRGYAAEAQINYNQNLKPAKVLNYLKIIKAKQGEKACKEYYAYILMIHGKYLQMMSLFFIFNENPEQIGKLFERFNSDISALNKSYELLMDDESSKVTETQQDLSVPDIPETVKSKSIVLRRRSPAVRVRNRSEIVDFDRLSTELKECELAKNDGITLVTRPSTVQVMEGISDEISNSTAGTINTNLQNREKSLELPERSKVASEEGYPSVLTVRSDDGPTLENQSSRMGVFTINQETSNEKPVWGSHNNSQQIYNNGVDGRWMIGSAEKGAGAVRSTIKAGKMRIPPEIGWQYYDGADWKKDPLLTVTGGPPPEYPQKICVSSTGAAAVKQKPCMGVYVKLEGEGAEANGRPVWAQEEDEEMFLFFSEHNYWMIGTDPESPSGFIICKRAGLVGLPANGWQFSDQGWNEDQTLTIV